MNPNNSFRSLRVRLFSAGMAYIPAVNATAFRPDPLSIQIRNGATRVYVIELLQFTQGAI